MRITALHIDGFGVFHNRHLSGLNPRLVLIQGDNEAGKSTLLGFIRTVLFGFPRANARGELFYPPIGGGVHGGRIDIVMNDGTHYTITRSPGKHGGMVTVEDTRGTAGNGDLLNRLLGGVSYEVFRNIFAFGLSELQSVETLEGDSVRSAVYGAGFGTGMLALPRAKKRIQGKLDSLFKAGGSKPLINIRLGQLEKVKKALFDAGAQIHRYDDALNEKRRIEAEIDAHARTLDRHRDRGQTLAAYARLWPEWISLQENESGLSALTPVVTSFPDEGFKRFSAEVEAIRRLETELAELSAQETDLAAKAASLSINTALLDNTHAITELIQRKGAWLENTRRLPLLSHEKASLETEIITRLEILGTNRSEAEILSMDRSVLLREEIRGFQGRFTEIEQRLSAATALLAEREASTEKTARELAAAKSALSDLDAPAPEPDARTVLKLKQGRDRYAGVIQEQADLQQRLVRAREDLDHALHEIDPGWEEQRIDRFDTSLQARHRVEAFSERLAAAREAIRSAEFDRREKEATFARAQEKLKEAEATLSPWHPVRYWLLTAPGILAAGGCLWWYRNGLFSQSPLLIAALTLGYFLLLLVRIHSIRNRRKVQMETIGTLAREADIRKQAAVEAVTAEETAGAALITEQTAWRSHLTQLGLTESLPPLVAMSLFYKVEAARQHQGGLRDIEERSARLAALQTAYTETAATLPELKSAACESGSDLLQAVDAFIARLPDHERHRDIFRRAQETVHRKGTEKEEAAKALTAARTGLESIGAEKAETETAFREWLRGHGLPDRLSPETALEALDGIEAVVRDIGRRNRVSEEIQRVESATSGYHRAVITLLSDLGCPTASSGESLSAVVDGLAAELEESRGNQRAKAVMETQLTALAQRVTTVRQRLVLGGEVIGSLFTEAGVETETAFCQRGQAHAERLRLLSAIDQNEKNLRRITGEYDISTLKSTLRDLTLPEITRRQKAEEETVAEIAQALEDLRNQRAEVIRRIGEMASDEDMVVLRAEEAALVTDLRALAFDWSRHALASYLIDQASQTFESAHQPQVIQDAGRFFEKLTGGRYTRLIAPMGEKTLQAVTADNRSVGPEVMSRGTAEQLYLAVRFGFIRHRAQGNEPLPVVMDDILVNFDPGRARAAAEAIVDLSGTHQVLFFTCHPETVERFQTVDASVRVVLL